MKISIFVIKFLFIGALFIVSNHQLHLAVDSERSLFYESFYGWLNNLFDHSMQIVGYVVNSEWLPENNQTNNVNLIGG